MGNRSGGEQIEVAGSLCTSKDESGQDQYVKPGQHNLLQTDRQKVIKVLTSSTNPEILTVRTTRRNLGTSLVKMFEVVHIYKDQESTRVLVGKKENDHRHKDIQRLTRQNVKKAEIEVAQRIKDQRNEVRRISRSCNVVEMRRIQRKTKKKD